MENKSKEKIRLVFFGSGTFAIPVLQALLQDDRLDVKGVYTQIDKIAGRKGHLTPTALGQYCLANEVPFERVTSVNDEGFLQNLRQLRPAIAVIVSFGQILKTPLLQLPEFGCLNVHSSLLPAYRGASPVVTAMLNGERVTGVTFMDMDEGLDSGGIYEQHAMDIPGRYTAIELEKDLSELAGDHIGDCIEKVCHACLCATPQNAERATFSKKIRKHHGMMDFQKDARALDCMIRAFYPWPSVTFVCPGAKRNVPVKITQAEVVNCCEKTSALPGTILEICKDGLRVACGSGILNLKRVIPEGKKEMNAYDFANGMHLTAGMVLLNGPAENQ